MSNCCDGYARTVRTAIFRRKEVGNKEAAFQTKLKRCLSIFDVIFIGLGHTMGSGMYVITGEIARSIAGPAAVISFAIAGFVAINVALCYAEFSSRIPWAGSAYAYSYITIGEIWAFLVGWNVLLENLIGLACTGITWGNYLDKVFNGFIANETEKLTGHIDNPILSSSPNVLGICMVLLLIILLVCGVNCTTTVNSIFTVINLICIGIMVGVGAYSADFTNWSRPDIGGFMPYGVSGVMSGAGVALFGYIGFEIIASAAEEMKDPCRQIPKSMVVAVIIVTVCYLSVTTVLTLDVPYNELSESASVVDTFRTLNYPWVVWIVTIGALLAMTASAMGSLYACSRAAYAMAIDGMLPGVFGHVAKMSMTPVFGIVFFGVLGSIVAGFIKLELLVELLSIGCLFAFTIVSASLIILRYTPSYKIFLPSMYEGNNSESSQSSRYLRHDQFAEEDMDTSSIRGLQDVLEGTGRLKLKFIRLNQIWPFSLEPGMLVSINVVNIILSSFVIALLGRFTPWEESRLAQTIIALLTVFFGLNFLSIMMHQQNPEKHYFKIPLVPLIPTFSLCLNVILMVSLQVETWIRFVVWILIGLLLYFGYGIRNTSSSRQLIPTTESSRLVIKPDKSFKSSDSSSRSTGSGSGFASD